MSVVRVVIIARQHTQEFGAIAPLPGHRLGSEGERLPPLRCPARRQSTRLRSSATLAAKLVRAPARSQTCGDPPLSVHVLSRNAAIQAPVTSLYPGHLAAQGYRLINGL